MLNLTTRSSHHTLLDAAVLTDTDSEKAAIIYLSTEAEPIHVSRNLFRKSALQYATILKQLGIHAGERLVVVALRDPYELAELPDLNTYVCAFSFRPSSARAAADVVSGAIKPQGATPVSIPNTLFDAFEIITI